MLIPWGHNPKYAGIQIFKWKKSHNLLPSCDTQQREVLRKYAVLGISSVETSSGSAGWTHARGDVHNLVSLELKGYP